MDDNLWIRVDEIAKNLEVVSFENGLTMIDDAFNNGDISQRGWAKLYAILQDLDSVRKQVSA